MILSINQPAYLPWLGYLHRIALSDVHVVLDNVQFEKNSYTNRNRIRTRDGALWLTVPVLTKGRFGASIADLEIADQRWAAKHLASLRQNYGRAPHFGRHEPFLVDTYARSWPKLDGLNAHVTAYLLSEFGITTPLLRASELAIEGRKSQLVLNICVALGATVYLSGPLGRGYLEEGEFADAGISIRYHDFQDPVYPQAFAGFEPKLASVDLLFNCGDASREILDQGQEAVA
jgi:hypothetical protein